MRRQVTLTADDFADGVVDSARWVSAAGATEIAGRLRVASNTPAPYNHASTGFLYPLEDHRFTVRVPTVPATHFSLQTVFRLETINGDVNKEWVDFEKTDKTLSFDQRTNYTDDRTNITYDAVEHAWWQIRISAGLIYWETSPDGSTWTVRREEAAVADLESAARCRLMSGYFASPKESEITVPYAEFDDFEIVGPGPWVPRAERAVSLGTKGGAVSVGKHKSRILPVVTGGKLQTHRLAIASSLTTPITRPDGIVICQHWNSDRIAAARAAGARYVLVYQNLTRCHAPGGDGLYSTALTVDEATELGAITSSIDSDAGPICLPGTPGYATLALERMEEKAVAAGADGVFCDDMNHSSNVEGVGDEQWRSEMQAMNEVVGPGLKARGLLAIPNMAGATGQRNRETAGWVERQFASYAGGLEEFFLTWPNGELQPYYYVEESMAILERQTKAGKLYLATSNGDNEKLKLAIALVLLRMHKGAHWFGTAKGGYGEQAWPPALEQAFALGKPLGPASGTTRVFEHGSVTADPRARTATITVG